MLTKGGLVGGLPSRVGGDTADTGQDSEDILPHYGCFIFAHLGPLWRNYKQFKTSMTEFILQVSLTISSHLKLRTVTAQGPAAITRNAGTSCRLSGKYWLSDGRTSHQSVYLRDRNRVWAVLDVLQCFQDPRFPIFTERKLKQEQQQLADRCHVPIS